MIAIATIWKYALSFIITTMNNAEETIKADLQRCASGHLGSCLCLFRVALVHVFGLVVTIMKHIAHVFFRIM